MKRRGVEATIIGKFTNSGKCVVKYYGQKIMDVDLNFLHYGLPQKPKTTSPLKIKLKEPALKPPSDFNQILLTMLSRLNLTGFEFVSSQYDHEVQGSSVIKPLQGRGRINGETTVIKPLFFSKKGVALSQGIYPSYSQIDSYWMAGCCLDTAVRNLVTVGANPEKIALLDNFCWCSSDEPERLYQLKQTVKGCYDFALAYQTPFISGKDSMFNDFQGYDKNGQQIKISILPTLLISSLGIIEDIYQSISIDFKFPGDLIYILGETKDELGGSEYYALFNKIGTSIPKPDPLKNKKLYQTFYQCVKENLIAGAISISRGGLAIALSKMAMAGKQGVKVFLKNLPGKTSRDDFALFSETQGRIIVSVNPKNKKSFEKVMAKVPFSQIGVVTEEERFIIEGKGGKTIVDLKLKSLLKSYKKRFKNY